MVFNSLTFLLFCAVVFPLYYRLGFRAQNGMLLAASYLFYGWWDWRFTALLLATTTVDYVLALKMDAPGRGDRARRALLITSLVANLGVLGVFKYFNFFSQSLREALLQVGIQPDWPTLNLILPVGISFYTFLSMSYTIDVYRRELPAARRFVDFALFVSYFPHLVAGPIVRASYLLPQCSRPRRVTAAQVRDGVWLFLLGMVKKVVIADGLGGIADAGFASQGAPVADANSWWYILAFTFQIYGDFSGYSDMARGLAKTMGFELVENFRAPYLVSGPSQFWQNWHISLSTWLRDYLYIPLGGNRNGRWLTYRNLMLTMLLGGLWHGAGLAYLLWGLYHGALLCVQRVWRELTGWRAPAEGWLRWPLVAGFFGLTTLGWLIFRAGACGPEIRQGALIADYLRAMATPAATLAPVAWPVLVLGALALLMQAGYASLERFSHWSPRRQALGLAVGLALVVMLGNYEGAQFIYFQF